MLERQMPDVYLFWVATMPVGLHPMCFEIGIEQFSYLLADYPDLVDDFLEASVRRALARIQATHRRAPNLILAGGIDMSHLLPHGMAEQVEASVHAAVRDAGGKIMIGSSSEFPDGIPLENYLAMRHAIESIRY